MNFQKRFFDTYLKNMDNALDTVPSVRLEMRENLEKYSVRYEDAFPIHNTVYKKLNLSANEHLRKKLQNLSLVDVL